MFVAANLALGIYETYLNDYTNLENMWADDITFKWIKTQARMDHNKTIPLGYVAMTSWSRGIVYFRLYPRMFNREESRETPDTVNRLGRNPFKDVVKNKTWIGVSIISA